MHNLNSHSNININVMLPLTLTYSAKTQNGPYTWIDTYLRHSKTQRSDRRLSDQSWMSLLQPHTLLRLSPLCNMIPWEPFVSSLCGCMCELALSLALSLPSLFLIMMKPLTSHVPVCPPGPSHQSELESLCEGNPVRTLIRRLESPMGTRVEWDGIMITSSEHPRRK